MEYEYHSGSQSDWSNFVRMRKRVPINTLLIAANIIIFFLVEIKGLSEDVVHMIHCGAAYTPYITAGEYYRLFTSMFLHFGIEHLINNMLVLLFLGDMLERAAGKVRYLLIYLIGGVGASWFSYQIAVWKQETIVSAGASGAVFAVMGALIYVIAANRGRLEDMTTKKIIFMAVLSLYFGISSTGVDNVAHLSGIILGFILGILLYRKKSPGEQRTFGI